jgi:hypothetical protein
MSACDSADDAHPSSASPQVSLRSDRALVARGKIRANETISHRVERRAIRSPKNILNRAYLFCSESVKFRNASSTIAHLDACEKSAFHRHFFECDRSE